MILKDREQKTIPPLSPKHPTCTGFLLGQESRSNCPGTPKTSTTGRVIPKTAGEAGGSRGALPGGGGAFRALQPANQPTLPLTHRCPGG